MRKDYSSDSIQEKRNALVFRSVFPFSFVRASDYLQLLVLAVALAEVFLALVVALVAFAEADFEDVAFAFVLL